MKIDLTSANQIITKAIKAVGKGCTYEDLRLNTVNLIAAASYLVGCIEMIEMMQDDVDEEKSSKLTKSYEYWRDIQRQFYEKEWNKKK